MNITEICIDRIDQDQTTIEWFEIDGETWGLAQNDDGTIYLLDCDGWEIKDCSDHDSIKNTLELYKEMKVKK